MSLSTIDTGGSTLRARRQHQEPPLSLKTKDVPGAQPGTTAAYKARAWSPNRGNFFDNSDIEGAKASRLIPAEAKSTAAKAFDVEDITGTRKHRAFVTNRVIDPLKPQYSLPSVVVPPPPEPPKQRRDPLKVDDIPGTKPRQHAQKTLRDPLNHSDIPLSHADSTLKAKLAVRTTPGNSLESRDITHAPRSEYVFTSTRATRTNSPRYHVPGHKGEYGEIEGSHPRKQPEQRHDRPLLSLKVEDIEGAHPVERRALREPRDPNFVADICQAGSKKALSFAKPSNRHTNPLAPEYRPLGWRAAVSEAPPPPGMQRPATKATG